MSAMRIEDDGVYTQGQVAELIGKHRATIRRALQDGELRGNRVGREWYVSGRDVRAWLLGEPPRDPDATDHDDRDDERAGDLARRIRPKV